MGMPNPACYRRYARRSAKPHGTMVRHRPLPVRLATADSSRGVAPRRLSYHRGPVASTDRKLQLYRAMARIRAFENAAEEASRGSVAAFGASLAQSDIRGPLHLSTGQEAVAAGVCLNLEKEDYVTSTHRGHGHTLAKGASMDAMMAELFGRASGPNRGKGGSMHLADFSVGMLGANGVVAAGMPIAVGAAARLKIKGELRSSRFLATAR